MENNAAKKVFNNNSEIKVALPTLIDNVGANIAASIKCGTDKKLTGAASLALHLQNKYSFGAEVTGDLKTKKADGVTVVATGAIDDLRTGWLQYNTTSKIAEIGALNTGEAWFEKSAGRFFIDTAKDGSFKDKASFEFVGEKRWDDHTQFKARANLTDVLTTDCSVVHQINDNLSVTASDTIRPLQAWQEKSTASYRFGVSLNYEFKN